MWCCGMWCQLPSGQKKTTTEEKFYMGMGTDDGDENFCSLKVHSLNDMETTQKCSPF